MLYNFITTTCYYRLHCGLRLIKLLHRTMKPIEAATFFFISQAIPKRIHFPFSTILSFHLLETEEDSFSVKICRFFDYFLLLLQNLFQSNITYVLFELFRQIEGIWMRKKRKGERWRKSADNFYRYMPGIGWLEVVCYVTTAALDGIPAQRMNLIPVKYWITL